MDLQTDIDVRRACLGHAADRSLFPKPPVRAAMRMRRLHFETPFTARLAGLFLFLLATLTGCSWRITPPTAPVHPVMVTIADYGRHTSLLLPGNDEGLVEFAWGDYDWFALGRTGTGRALAALFCSEGSTLGIRKYPAAMTDPQDAPTMLRQTGANRLYRFAVSQDRMILLRNRLLAVMEARHGKAIHNDAHQMDFVPDDRHYWFMHNCNHRTAAWLRELGCEVDGLVMYSNFKWEPQDDASQPFQAGAQRER